MQKIQLLKIFWVS